MDIEICLIFKDKNKLNGYFRAGSDKDEDEKEVCKQIMEDHKIKREEIDEVWIIDYEDYNEEKEGYETYKLDI